MNIAQIETLFERLLIQGQGKNETKATKTFHYNDVQARIGATNKNNKLRVHILLVALSLANPSGRL